MTTASYRAAEEADAAAISALVKRALQPQTLPGWTSEAVSGLLAKASPETMSEQIGSGAFAHVGVADGQIVGFILCKKLRFLNLLAVEPSLHRNGIGSRLINLMLKHLVDAAPDLSVVEVNATHNSLPFYRRLGFYPLSEFIEFDGCRFARLGYWRKNPSLPQSEC
ncbi:MAG: GNAT family N-acetyltransferase [Terriglobia bacterium]